MTQSLHQGVCTDHCSLISARPHKKHCFLYIQTLNLLQGPLKALPLSGRRQQHQEATAHAKIQLWLCLCSGLHVLVPTASFRSKHERISFNVQTAKADYYLEDVKLFMQLFHNQKMRSLIKREKLQKYRKMEMQQHDSFDF